MTDRLELPRCYREQLEILLHQHVPDAEVWAYGSRVNGRSHDGSDLGLVLRSLTLEPLGYEYVELVEALEQSNIPILVQAHDWARLPESFHREIERDYVVVQDGKNRRQNEEQRKVALGDVCTKIGSGATPRGGKDVYLDKGPYTLIRSQNVYNDGFHRDGLAFIGERHANALQNVEVLEKDVLLNITGDSVARVCQVVTDVLPARVNQHVAIIRPDPVNLDAGYLRYYLASPEMQAILLSWAGSGGTRNALTKGMVESLEIPLLPLPEQRAIAHVLGTLDDKIELNRRMNQTLEAMARAIFQDWFVDFGPVRAKLEGREPYLPPELWDLFPDRLVDSELGGIPEGWEVGFLNDSIEILSGGTPKTSVSTYWDGDVPWYTAKDAPALSDIFALTTERSITQAGVDNSSTRILPTKTTIISARGTVGRLACLGISMAMNQTCYGIRGAEGYPDFFTYWNTRNTVSQLQARTHGTIFDTITRETFKIAETVLVPTRAAGAFESVVTPLMNRILGNLNESLALSTQRDALLPKLVSGEVDLKSALTQ